MLWDLTGPPEAEPLHLGHPDWGVFGMAIAPDSNWLATSAGAEPSVLLWPVGRTYPRVLRVHGTLIARLAFTPDGERLVSRLGDSSVRVWPLRGSSGERSRILHRTEGLLGGHNRIALAPDGSFLATGSQDGRVVVLPLDGGPVRELSESGGFTDRIHAVAVGPRARLVAAASPGLVRIWDLESGEVRILDAGMHLEFTGDGDLWVESGPGLRRWNLDGAQPRILEEIDLERAEFASDKLLDVDPEGRQVPPEAGFP